MLILAFGPLFVFPLSTTYDFVMKRQWTDSDKEAWISARDEYRLKKKLKPPETLRQEDAKQYQTTLSLEKRTLVSRLETLVTKTYSWPIYKPPLSDAVAPFSGHLQCPHTFQERHTFSKLPFSTGDNLNLIVYTFYQESIPLDHPGVNYVSDDGICARRHEYLGPSPRIVGYQFNRAKEIAEIEWYDDHLTQKWVGKRRWSLDVYFDDEVQGWVSEARSDFCRNPDWESYLGVEP